MVVLARQVQVGLVQVVVGLEQQEIIHHQILVEMAELVLFQHCLEHPHIMVVVEEVAHQQVQGHDHLAEQVVVVMEDMGFLQVHMY
jgi:hypothetical protein